MRPMKTLLRWLLTHVPLFRRDEFRVSLFDVVHPTLVLRDPLSPMNSYLRWRHQQIRRFNLDAYQSNPLLRDPLEHRYGKIDRIAMVASFLSACASDGDVAEFGVFKGHTAMALAQQLNGTKKTLHLFDSFQGMPEITHPLDSRWKRGDLANPIDNIGELFQQFDNVQLVPGFFSETFPQRQDLRFSLCHIDVDLYTSVRECLEYVLPRLSAGGVIVFDDFDDPACPGVRKAIEESISEYVPLPTGQAVYWKPR